MLCTYSRRSSGEKLLSFNVSRDWNHVILLEDFTESAGNAAFMMLAQIFPGVCLKHDLLTFHSALVEYRGKAFAVCADNMDKAESFLWVIAKLKKPSYSLVA